MANGFTPLTWRHNKKCIANFMERENKMSEERPYPEGNCIAIYPNGDDSFDVVFGRGVDGSMTFQYGVNDEGKNTFVYIIPKKGMPITISTLILPTTTKGPMPYKCGTVTDIELIQSSSTKVIEK